MKKVLIWSAGVLGLLIIGLVIHIYSVTTNVRQDQRLRALARVDFLQDIDSLEANKIKAFARQIGGVEGTYFNVKDNILVYGYYPAKTDKQTVYDHIMAQGDYQAKPFVVSAEDAKSGCPVMGSKGFMKRAVVYYYNMKKRLFADNNNM